MDRIRELFKQARNGPGEAARWRQMRGVDAGPSLYDGQDIRDRHIRKCQVVLRRKGQDVANASRGLCPEEERRDTCNGLSVCCAVGTPWGRWHTALLLLRVVFFLLLLDSAIVIDEHEGFVVCGVLVTLRSRVSRAKVALRVMIRKRNLRWGFLLASSNMQLGTHGRGGAKAQQA